MTVRAAASSRQKYEQDIQQTLHTLNTTIDDTSLVGLTSLGIADIQELKHEVAEIFPASNLPAYLLQGLLQLQDRSLKPERIEADLTVLFRGSKQIGVYSILAAPALVIYGYQQLLRLAGKDVEQAFPDGYWQFYTEFGLREDTARHCIETTGFHQVAPDATDINAATCWVYTAIRTLLDYDDLLANEWHERMRLRILDETLYEHAQSRVSRPASGAKTEEYEYAVAEQVAHMRQQYHLERLSADWSARRPYSLPHQDASGDYPAYRRACFDAYFEATLQHLPPDLRAAFETHYANRASTELPAYQSQLTPLITLQPDTYQDQRTPFSLHHACIGLVVSGRYYLIPVCAHDAEGNLLVFPNKQDLDIAGVSLPLNENDDGSLRDRYNRPIRIERCGRVWAGNDRLGRLRPPLLKDVKAQVQAILRQVRPSTSPKDAESAPDILLARTLRATQPDMRNLLDQATRRGIEALHRVPIIINWDCHDPTLSLNTLRHTHRGCGDHALTLIRTSQSMVFDMSHICFDGMWGAALSEIMTRCAMAFYPRVAETRPASRPAPDPIVLKATSSFLNAARDAGTKSPVEVVVETSAVDLAAMTRLRERMKKIQLTLTINDMLLLARCIHAASYQPGDAARIALAEIATLEHGQGLRQAIEAHFTEQCGINPAILIPMDASATDPRMRIFPATFRNPLLDLAGRLSNCDKLVQQMRRQADVDERETFERERRELYLELKTFGALLDALKQVTMRGENFTITSLRLLAHLPRPLQHLVSSIPQKFDMLNEIIKGREVFSNIGRVAPGSSITRFLSSRDDGETKLLVWGVVTTTDGQIHITLRDFRPHVGPLLQRNRADLATVLAQDYLDSYVEEVNSVVKRIQRIFGYKSREQ